MSQTTLSIMNEHRRQAVENSPASEEFTVVGSDPVQTFKGIFDESFVNESKDKGNVYQKNIHARIMVNTRPDNIKESVTKVTREGSTDEYTFIFYNIDKEGQGLVWLS